MLKGTKHSPATIAKMKATRQRENNANWKGGRVQKADGRVFILKPDHPNTNSLGYIREHRFVMEKHLGRYLASSEEVHHIDNDPSNNDISNLQLMTKAQHTSLHTKGNKHRLGSIHTEEQRKKQSIRVKQWWKDRKKVSNG